jgi:hypothetical protein
MKLYQARYHYNDYSFYLFFYSYLVWLLIWLSINYGCTPVRTLLVADDGWCKFAGSLYPYLSCVAEGCEYVNVTLVHVEKNHFQGKRIPSLAILW